MLSDISESHSSEHSVHKCVYRNICVTVTEKPQIILIRHLHTAEYQLSALYKPVHVISVTYTKFWCACFPDNIFRHCYVLFRGQLYIVITALNDKRLYPIQFHYRCVISYPCVIHIELFRRRKIVGFSCRLRCLCKPQTASVRSSCDNTVIAYLYRILRSYRRQCRTVPKCLQCNLVCRLCRHKRPCSVMYRHHIALA